MNEAGDAQRLATLGRMQTSPIVFIGGGNMASALIGGLLRSGHAAQSVVVVEPLAEQRERLEKQFGVRCHASADAAPDGAELLVWAVKPQVFADAAAACAGRVAGALHLSVMAGVRCGTIARATGASRIVRSMPNTPALIGKGIAGLYATPEVTAAQRAQVEALLAPTGQTLWVAQEADLDAVTALSGSGPAYVFHMIEAMAAAGEAEGLSPDLALELARATVAGAGALAVAEDEDPAKLRENVTSPGGTTAAGLGELMDADTGLPPLMRRTIAAAAARGRELGK